MKVFNVHRGKVVPLDRANVDTDAIIPKQFLKSIKRSGFGPNLFDEWRYLDVGEPGKDNSKRPLNPDFVLNQPRYAGASILVARENFGCGSSREHAPWALDDYGFRCLIAPRFADIFRGNAGKQGLVAGVVSQEDCEQLWKILETEPGTGGTADLENRTVEAGSFRCAFSIDDYVRWILMEGLDDISLTLTQEDAIRAYEEARPSFKPRTLPAKHLPAQEVVSARAADMPRP